MLDYTNAGDQWLSNTEYQFICSRIPILCVDLLPVIAGHDTFGLIERDTPEGPRGLCLVGGRVLMDEHLHEALQRHVSATLGEEVELKLESLTLVGVYQYFKNIRKGELHDPRKNAVSVTYTGLLCGKAVAAGEAYAFHTFPLDAPPPPQDFGFGQGSVVYDGLVRLGSRRGHE
jgi:ADP-ribose pyrophosphatase YjhB (NUDIX family)